MTPKSGGRLTACMIALALSACQGGHRRQAQAHTPMARELAPAGTLRTIAGWPEICCTGQNKCETGECNNGNLQLRAGAWLEYIQSRALTWLATHPDDDYAQLAFDRAQQCRMDNGVLEAPVDGCGDSGDLEDCCCDCIAAARMYAGQNDWANCSERLGHGHGVGVPPLAPKQVVPHAGTTGPK